MTCQQHKTRSNCLEDSDFFSFRHEVNKILCINQKKYVHCTTSARRALRLSYHIWIFARFCLSTSPKQPTFGNCDLCDWIWHCYKLYKRRLNVLVMYFFYNFWSIHLSNHRIQVFIERVVNTSFINQSILFKLITLILKVNFN